MNFFYKESKSKKKNVCFFFWFLFSSPKHEVLMVSYCDQSLSVVRRPCLVNFLL